MIDLTLLRLFGFLLVLPFGRSQRMPPLIGTRRSAQNAVVLCKTGHYCHPLSPSRIVLEIVHVRSCILMLRSRFVVMHLAFRCVRRVSKIGEVVRFKLSLTLRTTNTSRRRVRCARPWSLVHAHIRAPRSLLAFTAFPSITIINQPGRITSNVCNTVNLYSVSVTGALGRSRRVGDAINVLLICTRYPLSFVCIRLSQQSGSNGSARAPMGSFRPCYAV
jgi:hypothetical protein